MGILDDLLGGGQRQREFKDFVSRYEQGHPSEGYSDQEVAERYRDVAHAVPPDQYAQAAQEALSRLSPEERAAFVKMLQERVQARGGASPKYRVVEAIGPDHSREFVVAVDVDGEVLGEGRGRSKKRAEQEAARSALVGGHPLALPLARGDLPPPRYTVSEMQTQEEQQ